MSLPALDPVPSAPRQQDLADIARRVAAQGDLWIPRLRFTVEYRWYERLVEAPDHEVWLLTWLPGQGTEIHDHGGSSGAFAVVRGELTERAFASAGRRTDPSPWTLPAGSLRAFGPNHVHEVTNRGPEPVVSIHAYSPALTTMSYYRHTAGRVLELVRTDRVDAAGVRR
jgi:predicted metal-dependent enzyme (double-stranded beta helix superfamily)